MEIVFAIFLVFVVVALAAILIGLFIGLIRYAAIRVLDKMDEIRHKNDDHRKE